MEAYDIYRYILHTSIHLFPCIQERERLKRQAEEQADEEAHEDASGQGICTHGGLLHNEEYDGSHPGASHSVRPTEGVLSSRQQHVSGTGARSASAAVTAQSACAVTLTSNGAPGSSPSPAGPGAMAGPVQHVLGGLGADVSH